MLDNFTIATFETHLGGTFSVSVDDEHLTMELIEVTDLTSRSGPAAANRERAPFSLLFRGPRQIVLPQRIYRMKHEDIGTFELFLVPIGPDRHGMRYEAIFT